MAIRPENTGRIANPSYKGLTNLFLRGHLASCARLRSRPEPAVIEKQWVYLVERPTGGVDVLKPSDFAVLLSLLRK